MVPIKDQKLLSLSQDWYLNRWECKTRLRIWTL